MTNTIKNIDRDQENQRYAARLMRYADEGHEFKSFTGAMVSADIRMRMADGTPLTRMEEEFFDMDKGARAELLSAVMERIDELVAHGHKHYSLDTIVGYLRYKNDTGDVNTRGMIINDHVKSSVARLLNYLYRDVMILKVKGVKGEVLKSPKSQSDPRLPAFFLKAV